MTDDPSQKSRYSDAQFGPWIISAFGILFIGYIIAFFLSAPASLDIKIEKMKNSDSPATAMKTWKGISLHDVS